MKIENSIYKIIIIPDMMDYCILKRRIITSNFMEYFNNNTLIYNDKDNEIIVTNGNNQKNIKSLYKDLCIFLKEYNIKKKLRSI